MNAASSLTCYQALTDLDSEHSFIGKDDDVLIADAVDHAFDRTHVDRITDGQSQEFTRRANLEPDCLVSTLGYGADDIGVFGLIESWAWRLWFFVFDGRWWRVFHCDLEVDAIRQRGCSVIGDGDTNLEFAILLRSP